MTAPKSVGLIAGVSTAFATGALHGLEDGALIQKDAALHVAVGHAGAAPSVSTQIAALRRMLLAPDSLGGASRSVAADLKAVSIRVVEPLMSLT